MKKTDSIPSEYIEALVFVPLSLADAVSNYVTENISSGVEFKDAENENLVGVKFYVSDIDNNDFRPGLIQYLSEIVNSEMPNVPVIEESRVSAKDWEESYRESIQPIIIDDDICIRPPWVESPHPVKYDIIIEPKMAFGTGHHETTRNCLKLISKYFKSGQRFLDFGCGAGILSILADKIGAGFIKPVDCDIIAVENTKDNFDINKVSAENSIEHGTFDKVSGDAPYDMVCANLVKSVIIENFQNLQRLTSANGVLLLSGILDKEKNEIDKIIEQSKMSVADFIHEGEWLTYCLKK